MIVVSQNAGLFGPYKEAELKEDHVLVDGCKLPYTVVGECSLLDIQVPANTRAEDYILIDGQLILKDE